LGASKMFSWSTKMGGTQKRRRSSMRHLKIFYISPHKMFYCKNRPPI
jgi:hypothetical protein